MLTKSVGFVGYVKTMSTVCQGTMCGEDFVSIYPIKGSDTCMSLLSFKDVVVKLRSGGIGGPSFLKSGGYVVVGSPNIGLSAHFRSGLLDILTKAALTLIKRNNEEFSTSLFTEVKL